MTQSFTFRILLSCAAGLWLGSFAGAAAGLGAGALDRGQTAQDREPLPAAFRRFDLDRDGVLSSSEKAAARLSVQGTGPRSSSSAPVPRPKAEQREQKRAKGGSSEKNNKRRQAKSSAPVGASRAAQQAARSAHSLVQNDPAQQRQGDQGQASDKKAANKSARQDQSAQSKARRGNAANKTNAERRSAELRGQHAREVAEQARVEAKAAEVDRRENRRMAVREEVARRRGENFDRMTIRRSQAVEREAKISDREAWNFVSRTKSKPITAPTPKFSLGTRSGVKHGKKRGSEYYSQQIKRAARTGRGRGRRGRGGGGGGGGGYY